ncbi:putative multidrug resistance-associated protein lethal(2)03659-like Protein [Tribolium castaneum]|uniref:Putative multidrug resistance-associated protein lethal(2)03659-like Protein n=2 Tax=Tribolium castaneum TaxID=7070 RepID=D2A4U2_TRICA|nr:PREDICTED: probable multidrug resistance-associated protein lethal(2)03659 [Tribolium castaneum]EFA05268.1 putative multidrug resistance-associated protein lethal(2)03659-like Protein [Tribolium castaneum]|eukprot:XP_001814494.2 PREDICTED: probable multidrug resistance-associated protein lethal(2)03659 [Tribolium castaneum]
MWVGYIGLAITQSTSLVGLIQYGTKTWSELDSQMTSVERVVEYAELEPEKDDGTTVPSDLWPNNGRILFDDVTMKYPLSNTTVLKSVTFNINPGEKIGIVGRTGAGKSSLISVLFRLFHFDGTVLIDGADTKTLPLSILRSKIAIIPQDPVLFLGSLRQNLDPFEQFSDSQLWSSLEEVELKEMVTNWAQGLETTILEGGANVSVGQRQLLCLVRAILRNSKIIVLDEATANVDLKTDEVIQKVVRRKFRNCTVLTIAHRLNTIMDSDKILVMDAGTVAEFGPPAQLLKNENGLFYGFVQTSGKK